MISILRHTTFGRLFTAQVVALIGTGLATVALALLAYDLAGLRRSAKPEDLPFLFAAQFSLSHVCWLLAYPLAGWLGSRLGLGVALIALSIVAIIGLIAMLATWPPTRRGRSWTPS